MLARTSIFDDMNDLLNRSFGLRPRSQARLNIIENGTEYEIQIAAAGMNRDDLTIELRHDDVMEITFEKKQEQENQDRKMIHEDFRLEKYTQSLLIPKNVDKKLVSAHMEDGILYITLPKKSEEQQRSEKEYIQIQ